MATAPGQVMNELKAGKFHPVYFLQGEESYFIDTIAAYIEKHALEESEKGFNQVIMYGKDSSMEVILTNARRFPMMASRQVVIVREAQEIANFGRQDVQQQLQAYIESPLPSTVLVLCYKYKTLDGRKKLSKSIAKNATLVDCKKMYDDRVPGWITEYVRSRNATIDLKTAQLLSDYIGNNLARITREVDKVLLNLKEPAKIDLDVVQKYIGISKDYNIFELLQALAKKDNVKAQRIVNYFAANPRLNPVIPIIAVLFGFFTKLLLLQHSKLNSESAIVNELRVPSFYVGQYISAARIYSAEQVINNIGHLRTADLMVKGVGNQRNSPGEILKELVFKLMH